MLTPVHLCYEQIRVSIIKFIFISLINTVLVLTKSKKKSQNWEFPTHASVQWLYCIVYNDIQIFNVMSEHFTTT